MNDSFQTSVFEEAATTTTPADVKFSPTFRLVASLSFIILLIISLFMNLLQLAAYIKERKVFKTMPFFIISFQMLICNLIIVIVMIIFMTTTAISDKLIFSEQLYTVLSIAECLSYNGLLFFAFLLTLNRLMVFAFPKSGAVLFDSSQIYERKVFKTMPFFIISFQMLICNLIIVIVMIIFMTTTAISDKLIFSEQVYTVLSIAECLSYNGLLFFAFLLTLNRLMVFAFPKSGAVLFDSSQIYVIIIIFWAFAGGLAIALELSPCPVVAKPEDLGFGFECIGGKANVFNYISQNLSTYLPVIMIIQYILIYAEIKIGIFCNSYCCSLSNLLPKNNQTKTAQNRAEMKLLLQAAMICSTFFIQHICWTYLPFVTSNFENGKELIYFAVMLSNILLYSVNAIVTLIFNGMVRKTALSFFKKGNISKNSLAAKTVTLF